MLQFQLDHANRGAPEVEHGSHFELTINTHSSPLLPGLCDVLYFGEKNDDGMSPYQPNVVW